MDLGNNFLSSQKKAAIAKSLLWNVLIDIFQEKKKIDISEKIISVKKNDLSFLITIHNPLLKQEFIFLEKEISEVFHKKLSKMWISNEIYKIKMK